MYTPFQIYCLKLQKYIWKKITVHVFTSTCMKMKKENEQTVGWQFNSIKYSGSVQRLLQVEGFVGGGHLLVHINHDLQLWIIHFTEQTRIDRPLLCGIQCVTI